MARRVFFSFHYERDIFRVNVVRNSWLTKPDREVAGFWDASLWEKAKLKGDSAIKTMIDNGLKNTSITVVLIGNETAGRKYVQYEIEQSYNRGNALLGIYIHNIKGIDGYTDYQGQNPFNLFSITRNGVKTSLASFISVYDWILNDGYNNFGTWVEAAALQFNK